MRKEENGFLFSIKIIFTLLILCCVLAIGIYTAEGNFNDISGRHDRSIVSVAKISDDIYRVELMGRERNIDFKEYKKLQQKSKMFISTGVGRIMEFIKNYSP